MAAPILSGFPTPEVLDEYERRIPGFGKILVDEAIKHREALEKAEERAHILAKRRLEYEVEIMKRGQICGLAIGIVAILAGCLTAALGELLLQAALSVVVALLGWWRCFCYKIETRAE
jgi:hypothetical protein